MSRLILWERYIKSHERHRKAGEVLANDPLAAAGLRAHAHDALPPDHESDHMSMICVVRALLKHLNICGVLVSPSCRFATRATQSLHCAKSSLWMLAHHEHMRLAIPGKARGLGALVSSPESISQPAGWKAMLGLGPREVTISTK